MNVHVKSNLLFLWNSFGPWMVLSFALHLVAAHQSVGYHSPDEHWQILEFVAYQLNPAAGTDALPWEFTSQIRPWLQPAVFVGMARFVGLFGVQSPQLVTELFRVLAAVLGFVSTWMMVAAAKPWLPNARAVKLAVLATSTFWFLPWFHARVSSEGFGTAFLLLGLVALLSQHWVWAGVALGVAFEARYLLGLQVLPAILWVLTRPRRELTWPKKWHSLGWGALGFAAVLAVSAIVDRWGYGNWVFPPWRYLVVNAIQGKAHQFGVYPWYDYLWQALVKMPPFLGAFALTVLFTFWVGFPRHFLTLFTLPFVAIHLAIPHKELRFLYPVAFAFPLMLAMWAGRVPAFKKWWPPFAKVARVAFILLWICNGLYLMYGVWSAEKNRFRFQLEVADRFPRGLTLVSDSATDPYYDPILPIHWGKPPGYTFVGGVSLWRAQNLLSRAHLQAKSLWFFHERSSPSGEIAPFLEAHCVRVYSVLPDALLKLNLNDWVSRAQVWSLWRCGPIE